jgi:hypothetical protein
VATAPSHQSITGSPRSELQIMIPRMVKRLCYIHVDPVRNQILESTDVFCCIVSRRPFSELM